MKLHPKIRYLKDLDVAKSWNIMVYGKPNVGKTTFAATAPDALFLAVENGLKSVADMPDLPVWPIETFQDLTEAYQYLRFEKHNFRSVVIDSLSEVFYGPMTDHVLHETKRGANDDPELLSQRDYGRIGMLVRDMIRAYRDLPLNTIVTAGEKSVDDEGRIVKGLHLSGQSRDSVPYQFDLIGWMYESSGGARAESGTSTHHLMRIKGHELTFSKSRIPFTWQSYLPTDVEDPTWDKLMYVMQEAQSQYAEAKKAAHSA